MAANAGGVLAERFRETHEQLQGLWLKLWGGGFLVILVGFSLAWFFIQPAPPRTIVIAAGPRDGAYYAFAEQYAKQLARQGVTLQVRETAGSVENYQLLQNDSAVDLAIVQGGTRPETLAADSELESIASLYLEPVWLFRRGDFELPSIKDLAGARVAIGNDGSGTQAIARLILEANGVDPASTEQYVHQGGKAAVDKLRAGELDAMFMVMSPTAPLIRELLREPSDTIQLVPFERSPAYGHRFSFLSAVTLDRGVVDLQHDLPRKTVPLIAPAATLVATAEFHDALIPLLLRAAVLTHEKGDEISAARQFPSTEFCEFSLNESARRYFEQGPPFLQKYLPFWIASAIDRGKILLLPLITLMLPLVKMAPPIYRWRIRSRIYRWYEVLRDIDADLRRPIQEEVVRRHAQTIAAMERELDELDSVPLPYMEEFYNLRLHVEFVGRRLDRAIAECEDQGSPSGVS